MGSLIEEAAKRADSLTSAVEVLNPRAARIKDRRERKGGPYYFHADPISLEGDVRE